MSRREEARSEQEDGDWYGCCGSDDLLRRPCLHFYRFGIDQLEDARDRALLCIVLLRHLLWVDHLGSDDLLKTKGNLRVECLSGVPNYVGSGLTQLAQVLGQAVPPNSAAIVRTALTGMNNKGRRSKSSDQVLA